MAVGPEAQAPIFGQAVAPDTRAREYDVAVCGPDLNGLDHLDKVHAISLGKQAPLVKKRQNSGPEAVFHDFCRLRLNGPIQHGKGIFISIDDFLEMASVGSSSDVNIVVQMDRRADYDNTYGDWTGTRRFLIQKNDTPATTPLVDLEEVNMGHPDTLRDFVLWAVQFV